MTNAVFLAIAGLTLLQIKHFICDFVLQTSRHVQFKGIYGHPAGVEHSAIHAIGTLPCLWLVGATWPAMAGIAFIEFLIHYHEDWFKERMVKRHKWGVTDHQFWIALGADQLVHQLTYIAMVVALLTIPSARF
jgi:hypothetical protein